MDEKRNVEFLLDNTDLSTFELARLTGVKEEDIASICMEKRD